MSSHLQQLSSSPTILEHGFRTFWILKIIKNWIWIIKKWGYGISRTHMVYNSTPKRRIRRMIGNMLVAWPDDTRKFRFRKILLLTVADWGTRDRSYSRGRCYYRPRSGDIGRSWGGQMHESCKNRLMRDPLVHCVGKHTGGEGVTGVGEMTLEPSDAFTAWWDFTRELKRGIILDGEYWLNYHE